MYSALFLYLKLPSVLYIIKNNEICNKWNITYIDIYAGTIPGTNISCSYDLLDMDKGIYGETGAEDVHINGSGYELLAPHIGDWMATMKQNVNPLVAE